MDSSLIIPIGRVNDVARREQNLFFDGGNMNLI